MAIVQCPVCRTQLHEPPGAPYFTCVCGTVLQSSSVPPPPGPPPGLSGPPGPPPPNQSNGESYGGPPHRPPSSGSRPQSASSEPPDMSSLSLHDRRPSSSSSSGFPPQYPPPPQFAPPPPPQFAPPPPSGPQYHQCSTCGSFLNLPDNLPRDKNGDRKVRCGSCQAVNRFPDPQPESPGVAPPSTQETVTPPPKQEAAPPPVQQEVAAPPPKQGFEPPSRRKPFAFEQQGYGLGAAEASATPAYGGEQQDYPPAPSQPSTLSPGPPPPYPEHRTPSPQYQVSPSFGGGASPLSLHYQNSMPGPYPHPAGMQSQYSMPPAYHEAAVQPGAYPGGVAPPGVGGPPTVAPVEKKKKKSFFGKLKRQFEEEDEFERDVKVNGFPVPDAQVKKAELRSGPVQPGDYWYDVRAGFWGIMDGPCSGIIPAGIHELVRNKKLEAAGEPGVNDLQLHFSGGTTGVIINGRELAPRDLTVLKKRGLSEEPRSYWLDIAGQLTDALTNQPVMQLGHLAPSLAQGQAGLGMRIPEEELRRLKLEEVRKALQEQEERRPIVARVSTG